MSFLFFVLLSISLLLPGCGKQEPVQSDTLETSASSESISAAEPESTHSSETEKPEQTESESSEEENSEMMMNVNVNGQNFTATLENNRAVDVLVQMMEKSPLPCSSAIMPDLKRWVRWARVSLPATARPRPMPGILYCIREIRSSCSMAPTHGTTQGLVILMTLLAGRKHWEAAM